MALNVIIFKTVAPEFNDINSTNRKNAADLAELQVTEGVWRKKADLAVALMTAHILKISDPKKSDKSGPVSSSGTGSLSRSYGSIDFSDNSLKETSYGREFLRVRRQISTSPLVF